MGVSIGGLGVMSLRTSFSEVTRVALVKGDIRTMMCGTVCLIVLLILAYLTNPSENSFRAYLTEQSFRHYLSRLDDDQYFHSDDTRLSTTRRTNATFQDRSFGHSPSPPFHFANRASVSLRTPKHVFRSFGLFTVAAVVPNPMHLSDEDRDRDGYGLILDSWFIGAFGKWWRVGIMEAWYQDFVTQPHDEEGWRPGILGIKALDKLNDYDGLPFTTKNTLPFSRGPPRLRNRDRSSQRQQPGFNVSGNATPPPLPRSVSLPLHTARPLAPHIDKALIAGPEQIQVGLHTPTRARKTSLSQLDQSPIIADILQQISQSRESIHELRSQLSVVQTAASESHTTLHSEVDLYRERKKAEDLARAETKAKNKVLEESKRNAESNKRDAEKRLRTAESKRDGASGRIKLLEQEIGVLQGRLQTYSSLPLASDKTEKEKEIVESLNRKREEVKVAEEVVSALNVRAKELEEKVADAREKLKVAREHAEMKKRERGLAILQNAYRSHDPECLWSTPAYDTLVQRSDVFPDSEPNEAELGKPSRPLRLSFTGISNSKSRLKTLNLHPSLRSRSYSIDDAGHQLHLRSPATDTNSAAINFAPFDTDNLTTLPDSTSIVPVTPFPTFDNNSSLDRFVFSSTLATSLGQSDNDSFLDLSEWQGNHSPAVTSTSPIPVHPSTLEFDGHDPLDLRFLPDNQAQTHSLFDEPISSGETATRTSPRRWRSASNAKTSLNPDAKVFQFPSRSSTAPSSNVTTPSSTYDKLNPNGLVSGVLGASSATARSSLLRAFAPSPAERQALQRALGGSNNVSLEKLPMLPDVSGMGISNSTAERHAPVSPSKQIRNPLAAQNGHLSVPDWMHNLPPVTKSNFKPWEEDEELVVSESK